MANTHNLNLELIGDVPMNPGTRFGEWRERIAALHDANVQKIDEHLSTSLDDKTEKKLLIYNGTKITDTENNVVTFDEVHSWLMDKPYFVVLVYQNYAYHPNGVSNEQIVFAANYPVNGMLLTHRLTLLADGTITLYSTASENIANRVNTIAESEKNELEKYPSINAVTSYVDQALGDANKWLADYLAASDSDEMRPYTPDLFGDDLDGSPYWTVENGKAVVKHSDIGSCNYLELFEDYPELLTKDGIQMIYDINHPYTSLADDAYPLIITDKDNNVLSCIPPRPSSTNINEKIVPPAGAAKIYVSGFHTTIGVLLGALRFGRAVSVDTVERLSKSVDENAARLDMVIKKNIIEYANTVSVIMSAAAASNRQVALNEYDVQPGSAIIVSAGDIIPMVNADLFTLLRIRVTEFNADGVNTTYRNVSPSASAEFTLRSDTTRIRFTLLYSKNAADGYTEKFAVSYRWKLKNDPDYALNNVDVVEVADSRHSLGDTYATLADRLEADMVRNAPIISNATGNLERFTNLLNSVAIGDAVSQRWCVYKTPEDRLSNPSAKMIARDGKLFVVMLSHSNPDSTSESVFFDNYIKVIRIDIATAQIEASNIIARRGMTFTFSDGTEIAYSTDESYASPYSPKITDIGDQYIYVSYSVPFDVAGETRMVRAAIDPDTLTVVRMDKCECSGDVDYCAVSGLNKYIEFAGAGFVYYNGFYYGATERELSFVQVIRSVDLVHWEPFYHLQLAGFKPQYECAIAFSSDNYDSNHTRDYMYLGIRSQYYTQYFLYVMKVRLDKMQLVDVAKIKDVHSLPNLFWLNGELYLHSAVNGRSGYAFTKINRESLGASEIMADTDNRYRSANSCIYVDADDTVYMIMTDGYIARFKMNIIDQTKSRAIIRKLMDTELLSEFFEQGEM